MCYPKTVLMICTLEQAYCDDAWISETGSCGWVNTNQCWPKTN